MKKKIATIIVIALITANVFLSLSQTTNNQSQLSLTLLEASADDEGGETDPPDPEEEIPPTRPFPSDSILVLINGSNN